MTGRLKISTFAGSRPARRPGSFVRLVKIPAILVIFLVIVVSSNAWSFLDPTLEPHLRQVRIIFHKISEILPKNHIDSKKK